MSQILTKQAFENAIRVNGAIGGSTNAVIHLIAIAGRLGVDLTLEDWDRLGRDVPTIVDLMPSGRFLMEDFYYAGGLNAVMRVLAETGRLHKDALTVTGATIGELCQDAPNYNTEVIRSLDNPLTPQGGIVVLQGNLAPSGAVIKPSAATPSLMQHRGRAVVFENIEHYHERIDDPALEIDATSVMVLKNCGPKGYPGMAEVGNMPLPAKLLKQGVTDMVRISDARMSGTAYGTVVLHAAPEAAAGGTLALVKDGDWIELARCRCAAPIPLRCVMRGLIDKAARYPSLEGRVVFITGGGSGIGESLVEHFCEQGAKVTFVDIAAEASQAVVDRIAGKGLPKPDFIPCDLRRIDDLRQAVAATQAKHGPIRVLCNNAGNDDRHWTKDVTVDYWDDRMAVNLRPQFFAAQAVRDQMRDAGGGSIINFGSITWMVGDPDCPAYVTAKAAITGLTRALAREFGPEKIRVNCMIPGWVMTERQMRLWLTPDGEKQIDDRQCLKERLYPADIARMALFLAADDSRMCTSQHFIVDGGWV